VDAAVKLTETANEKGDGMRKRTGLFIAAAIGAGIACLSGSAYAGAISISSTSFTNVTGFDSLGTGNVAWNDGTTINGVFMKCASNNYGSAGVPATVNAQNGGGSTPGAYNMGITGDNDRALGWKNGSTTMAGSVGIQFQNNSGATNLTVGYNFVLEQWSANNTSAQAIVLQYKVTSTGGNILTDSSWIALGTNYTPVLTTAGAINGNANQFSISGTFDVGVLAGKYLTFRVYDADHSGTDDMIGLESATITVIPEPATLGMLGLGALITIPLRRMRQ
jgi:hypothetical protein